jgi:hypothetical protein
MGIGHNTKTARHVWRRTPPATLYWTASTPVIFYTVTPRQIFRALPAHIRHVGCVDASCDGGSKCSSYEDFLGYVGQSLCARAQSTLRVRARACLHPQVSRRWSGRPFTARVVERAKTLMRSWLGRFFPRSNHVDATRLNAFQMGTGTTGARAINLAKRILEEDKFLQRGRGEYSASVRGGNKVRAALVGGESSGCQ